jgi:tetratricopeptide (TPR) repeat protein
VSGRLSGPHSTGYSVSSAKPAARFSDRRRALLILLFGLLVIAAALHGHRLVQAVHEWRLHSLTVAQLTGVVEKQPDDLAARYELGLRWAQSGQYSAATRELLAVLAREPSRAEVLNDLGVVYLLQQRYYESLVALNGALAAQPGFGRAAANLGRLHLATKMPYTAIREFERALRLGVDDPPTLCDMGIAYQQTLNFQSALRSYRRALQRDPRSATVWLGLARTYEGLTDYEPAIGAARKALQLRPGDAAAMAALGRLLMLRGSTTGDLNAAHRLLESAAAGDPQDSEARYDLGRCLRRLGDERDAITALREALRLAPDHAGAAYQLSQALIAAGQMAEGERVGAAFRRTAARARDQDMLEEQVYQKPGDLEARLRLARLYAASQRPGLALLQCREVLNRAPGHAGARRLMESLTRHAPG